MPAPRPKNRAWRALTCCKIPRTPRNSYSWKSIAMLSMRRRHTRRRRTICSGATKWRISWPPSGRAGPLPMSFPERPWRGNIHREKDLWKEENQSKRHCIPCLLRARGCGGNSANFTSQYKQYVIAFYELVNIIIATMILLSKPPLLESTIDQTVAPCAVVAHTIPPEMGVSSYQSRLLPPPWWRWAPRHNPS